MWDLHLQLSDRNRCARPCLARGACAAQPVPYLRGMRGALSARRSALRADRSVCRGGRMSYVIIGSGVAGIAAIEAIRSVDSVSSITLIGDNPYGFYSRPGLAYYLTGELHDKALFPRTADDLRKLNFRYIKGQVKK